MIADPRPPNRFLCRSPAKLPIVPSRLGKKTKKNKNLDQISILHIRVISQKIRPSYCTLSFSHHIKFFYIYTLLKIQYFVTFKSQILQDAHAQSARNDRIVFRLNLYRTYRRTLIVAKTKGKKKKRKRKKIERSSKTSRLRRKNDRYLLTTRIYYTHTCAGASKYSSGWNVIVLLVSCPVATCRPALSSHRVAISSSTAIYRHITALIDSVSLPPLPSLPSPASSHSSS